MKELQEQSQKSNVLLLQEQQPSQTISLAQILSLYDIQFVKLAYDRVLGRPADADGLAHYLQLLRNNQIKKIEVLGRLYYSREGKKNGVPVKGLLPLYIFHSLCRIPVLGYLIRLFSSIAMLPSLVRSIENLDNYTHTATLNNDDQHRALQNELNERYNLLAVTVEKNKECVTELLLKTAKTTTTHKFDKLYRDFEDQFRGSRIEVKEKLSRYLPHINKAHQASKGGMIIDIGCGRGEWLEMLRECGLLACGIDSNTLMINLCKELGLETIEEDAVEYLKSIPDNSIAGITGFHIVEHIPVEQLLTLFTECYRVLKPQGYVIFETPNPANLVVGACNFYTDPTHLNPIPAHTLQFLLQAVGFPEVKVLTEKKPPVAIEDPYLNEFVNSWINQAPDYGVIGKKI